MEWLRKISAFCVLLWGLTAQAQDCPEPLFPENGELVPVDVTISWTEVIGTAAYLIQLGTTEGGSEITPRTSTGQSTQFTPPRGLPENSTVYVEIYTFNTLTNTTTLCTTYRFRTGSFTSPPGCTELQNPPNNGTAVPVQTDIQWRYSATATSYRVSLGLTPGGSELIDNEEITDELSFSPSDFLGDDLPAETQIFVRIIPENRLGPAVGCQEFRFTTGLQATLPECGSIIYPMDLEFDVPLSPIISWDPVDGAEGYLVSIGTSPFQNDILDNGDFIDQTETGVIAFEPNRQYFITITPYNSVGEAQNCQTTSFFTLLGCGPYFDASGNLIDLRPELDFPAVVGICGAGDSSVRAEDPADGYRWYRIPPFGREELLAEGPEFEIPGAGDYRLEIYDVITTPDGEFECRSEQRFTVSESEAAVIERTDVRLGAGFIDIEVEVSGIGEYEFALNSPEGPYQDSNRFTNLPIENYRVFVRDKNGCGISETLVAPDLTLDGFPKFFTPNGDGINDTWQFIPPPSGLNPIRVLHVFDRYGQLIAQIDPRGEGWDGTFNGTSLPASDYWFRAVDENNEVIQGHFSLKR
jgi:gliding motility-associated-like protein